MILKKMLRVSSIFSKLDIDKGGINTALSKLDTSTQQELIGLMPELEGKKELNALIQDYNSEYLKFQDLVKKTYTQEVKEESITEEKTTYDILIGYVHKIYKIGGSINDITLCDAFLVTHENNKEAIWKNLIGLAGNEKKESTRMAIRSYIKRSNIDNWQENKKWLEFYL